MDYRPRPCLQSYEAYTPDLAELDAAHLRGKHSPDYIYFSVNAGPNYPSGDDGLSWPELLTRYEPYGIDYYLILKRSAVARTYVKTLICQTNIGFNQLLQVPSGLIWAEMDIQKSMYGKVVSQFYKPPIVNIVFSVNGQPLQELRLVAGMAKAGFLISPFIPNTYSFYLLYCGQQLTNQQVRAFAITVTGDSACYKKTIPIKLYTIQLK